MQDYPHLYVATANGKAEGIIDTGSPGLERNEAMPPAEFDGPGTRTGTRPIESPSGPRASAW